MSEVIQDQELDQAFEQVVNKEIKRPELDKDGRPEGVKVLSIAHIRGKLANFEWRTVEIWGEEVAVKIFKGDAYDHIQIMGKDDVAYMGALAKDKDHQDDVKFEIDNMDYVDQLDAASFAKRNEEAMIVSYILEPKFCMRDECKDGAICVSELSDDARRELIDAYNDVNTPQEVVDNIERFPENGTGE